MQKAIEDLATGVGRGIGGRIEIATSDAAGPAIECMKAFLGPRYGSTSPHCDGNGRQGVPGRSRNRGADVSAGGVLNQTAAASPAPRSSSCAVSWATWPDAWVTSRSAVCCRDWSRFVAGGVGLVLIAKDVWDLRYGVLPIIATELKSEESKNKVQDELATSSRSDQGPRRRDRAPRLGSYCRDLERIPSRPCDGARFIRTPAGLPQFPRSGAPRCSAPRRRSDGPPAARRRRSRRHAPAVRRTLDLAVNKLPEPAMDIARQSRRSKRRSPGMRSPAATSTKWSNSNCSASPSRLTSRRIAGPGARPRRPRRREALAAIDPPVRDVLLDIDPKVLAPAARSLDPSELSSFPAISPASTDYNDNDYSIFLDTNPPP